MRVIYEPPVPPTPPMRPVVSVANYRPGTIVEMGDGSQWEVDWDDQDKRYIWVLVKSSR